MVPTTDPDNVDYKAIAMEEKARIRDKMPSAILNVASSTWTRMSSTADDDASSSSGDPKVSFRFSAVNEIRSYMHP
jgi:hypothetical protein